jgi:hypothetical protein
VIDLLFLAILVFFFVAAIGYAGACDRGLGGA